MISGTKTLLHSYLFLHAVKTCVTDHTSNAQDTGDTICSNEGGIILGFSELQKH